MLPEKASLNSSSAGFFHILRRVSGNPDAVNKIVCPVLITEGRINLNSCLGNIYYRRIVQILNDTLGDKCITHTRRNTRSLLLWLFVSHKDFE